MFRFLLLGLCAHLAAGQLAGTGVDVLNANDLTFYRDCHALFKAGHKADGAYKLIDGSLVSCVFDESHGYTVILRRQDGTVNFARGMQDYINGFGSPSGELWLGLDRINALGDNNNTLLMVRFTDWEGSWVELSYSLFYVHGRADNYVLHIGGYHGLPVIFDSLSYNNLRPFATHDVRDQHACVDQMKGGWWYNWCSYTLPTGHYYVGGWYNKTTPYYFDGIFWNKYKGLNYSLKTFLMGVSQNN